MQAHSVCPPGPRSVGGVVPRITIESGPGFWRVRPEWPEGGYWAAGGRHNINDDDGTDPAFIPQLKEETAEAVCFGLGGRGRAGSPGWKPGKGEAEAGAGQTQGEVNVC